MRLEARGPRPEQSPSRTAADPGADPINPELNELLGRFRFNLEFVRASGPFLYDADGTEYLDLCTNYGALPLGHNPPEVWEALLEAQRRQAPALLRPGFPAEARELARRLIALAPGEMHAVTYAVSGGEAVEAACDAARAATGRPLVVVAQGGFHGGPLGEVAAAGLAEPPAPGEAPAPHARPDGFVEVPYGDAAALERAITPDTVGFLVEPIQGEGGIVVPPDGYLRACRELCTRHRVLFMADEIQTGLGRTGRRFACDHEGVRPDVLILGKALGGGLMPVSAVLASREVLGVFRPGDHGSTFGGNPLACAVARRAIEILERDRLAERAAALGDRFRARLAAMRSPIVREVRGRGLLIGIELEADAGPAKDYCKRLMHEGVLCKDTVERVLRVAPPLIVDERDLDEASATFARVLGGRP